MSTVAAAAVSRPSGLAYHLRVLRTIAAVEFKLKYADSALGYVWSLAKPLSYFGVLWLVFGRLFDTGIERFPLYLLLGIVLYLFFVDACGMALTSIVYRGPLLRRLAFPPIVIPVSVTVTGAITFFVNAAAAAVFVGVSGASPGLDWLLLVPLVLELYVFIVGIGLILAALFVRLRDIGPLWELAAQILIFATPVMYPITLLPDWAQRVAFVNPLVQVMQDVRHVVLGDATSVPIASDILGGSFGHVVPIAVALAVLAVGLAVFRREAPRFAELV
ncbi:MAG: ABC transporter permease [Actinomycetota bacterium]|nr:ABC transporter permease [Actinomycetota bacterium]